MHLLLSQYSSCNRRYILKFFKKSKYLTKLALLERFQATNFLVHIHDLIFCQLYTFHSGPNSTFTTLALMLQIVTDILSMIKNSLLDQGQN